MRGQGTRHVHRTGERLPSIGASPPALYCALMARQSPHVQPLRSPQQPGDDRFRLCVGALMRGRPSPRTHRWSVPTRLLHSFSPHPQLIEPGPRPVGHGRAWQQNSHPTCWTPLQHQQRAHRVRWAKAHLCTCMAQRPEVPHPCLLVHGAKLGEWPQRLVEDATRRRRTLVLGWSMNYSTLCAAKDGVSRGE